MRKVLATVLSLCLLVSMLSVCVFTGMFASAVSDNASAVRQMKIESYTQFYQAHLKGQDKTKWVKAASENGIPVYNEADLALQGKLFDPWGRSWETDPNEQSHRLLKDGEYITFRLEVDKDASELQINDMYFSNSYCNFFGVQLSADGYNWKSIGDFANNTAALASGWKWDAMDQSWGRDQNNRDVMAACSVVNDKKVVWLRLVSMFNNGTNDGTPEHPYSGDKGQICYNNFYVDAKVGDAVNRQMKICTYMQYWMEFGEAERGDEAGVPVYSEAYLALQGVTKDVWGRAWSTDPNEQTNRYLHNGEYLTFRIEVDKAAQALEINDAYYSNGTSNFFGVQLSADGVSWKSVGDYGSNTAALGNGWKWSAMDQSWGRDQNNKDVLAACSVVNDKKIVWVRLVSKFNNGTAVNYADGNGEIYYNNFYVDAVIPTLTGIAVKTAPKTVYDFNTDLDVAGGVLTATYSDGSTKDVNITADMVSGFSKSTTGKQTLTVTYEGKTATYEVEVKDKSVTGVAVKTAPAKTTYDYGDALDVTGGKLTLTYSDNSTEDIDMTAAMVSGYDPKKSGKQTVTVTYAGKTATFDVTVSEKLEATITLVEDGGDVDSKGVRTIGKNEYVTYKLEGIPANATWIRIGEFADGYWNMADIQLSKNGTDFETAARYSWPNLVGTDFFGSMVFSWGTGSKFHDYLSGNNGVLYVRLVGAFNQGDKNGTAGKEYTGDESSKITYSSLKFEYATTATEYNFMTSDDGYKGVFADSAVKWNELCTIANDPKPVITLVDDGGTVGNDLVRTLKNLEYVTYKIEGIPNDATWIRIGEIGNCYFNQSTVQMSTDGVNYDGVARYSWPCIETSDAFGKLVFSWGTGNKIRDMLNAQREAANGAPLTMYVRLVAAFNQGDQNGSAEKPYTGTDGGDLKYKSLKFEYTTDTRSENFMTSDDGYKGIFAAEDVEWNELGTVVNELKIVPTKIEVTTKPTDVYALNAALDVTGGKLTVTYSDDSTEEVAMTADMVSGFSSNAPGKKTLTVTYLDQTTTYDVTINDKQVTGIAVSTDPTKTVYETGDTLDVTGGKVTVNYSNDTSDIIDLTAAMVTGFDGNTIGEQTLTVTYAEKTATFKVNVKEWTGVKTDGEIFINVDDKKFGFEMFEGEDLENRIADADKSTWTWENDIAARFPTAIKSGDILKDYVLAYSMQPFNNDPYMNIEGDGWVTYEIDLNDRAVDFTIAGWGAYQNCNFLASKDGGETWYPVAIAGDKEVGLGGFTLPNDGDNVDDCKANIKKVLTGNPEKKFLLKVNPSTYGKALYTNLILNYSYNSGDQEDLPLTDEVLEAEKAAGEAVAALIDKIGDVAYTEDCKAKITAAREAYDKLTAQETPHVKNYYLLTDAEEQYDALEKKAVNQQKADEVIALIKAIGKVDYTIEARDAIIAALDGYDALTAGQKRLVSNYGDLQAAQLLYTELEEAAQGAEPGHREVKPTDPAEDDPNGNDPEDNPNEDKPDDDTPEEDSPVTGDSLPVAMLMLAAVSAGAVLTLRKKH